MDTAGQERFRAINKSYYKKADCCLLVYDITDIKSFEDCKDYYNKHINDKCKEDIPVILLGNKTDLSSKRKVDPEDAANFALENNYIFMETSCAKNEYVYDVFENLIGITIIKSQKNNGNNNLKNAKNQNNSGCC